MNKVYSRINWENEPSTKTPLNEHNLNKIDFAVDEIDNRVIELDSTKAKNTDLQTLSTRVDNLILNAGDSSAECTDARVTEDGTTYDTLKKRLDAEHSSVIEDISQLSNEIVIDNVYSFNDITKNIDLVLNSYYAKTTSGSVVNGVVRVPIEDEGYATGLFSVSEGEEFLISGTIHMEASLILEIETIDGINYVSKQICQGYSIKERITDYHYVVPEGVTNVIFQSVYSPLAVKKCEPQKINDIVTTTHNNSIISDYDFEDIRDNVGVYHNYISPDGYPEDANADTTGLIYCEKGDTFKFTATAIYSTYCIGLYDSSLVLIDALYHNYSGQLYENEIYTVTDDNVSFIRFCSYNTPLELYREIPKTIGKKVDELSDEILGHNQNKLYGKSIAFEGDSIMQGAGSNGGYARIIATRNNMKFQNNAIGGGTIVSGTKFASGEDKHHICETITDLPLYDYIIFNGGVNDVATAITYDTISLGEIKSGFNETLDTTIFSDALESICKVLRTKYADKKVGYIFNHRIHYEPLWVNTWKPQMIKIFEKWGVPYLDLESVVPPLNLIEDLKNTYTYNGDGWHPNILGYNTYYVEHIENWLMSL